MEKSDCSICGKAKSVVMNSKLVCMRCDELLFDLEIECDDEKIHQDDSLRQVPQPVVPAKSRI